MPGNYRNGAAAVREILRERADIDLGNSYLADGSGLSPHNQVTVSQLVDTLAHLASMADPSLRNALAVSGISGTLQHRYGFNSQPLRGNIRAKTGHLAGHYNLAGFLTDAQGQTLSFTVFISGFSLAPPHRQGRSAAVPARPSDQFFREFLTALYQHKSSSPDSGA